LQELAGGKQVYVMEGDLAGAADKLPADFLKKFKIIQSSDEQITIASIEDLHPSDCLRELLKLSVKFDNISVKKPTLNEVFLKLTGRDLRE